MRLSPVYPSWFSRSLRGVCVCVFVCICVCVCLTLIFISAVQSGDSDVNEMQTICRKQWQFFDGCSYCILKRVIRDSASFRPSEGQWERELDTRLQTNDLFRQTRNVSFILLLSELTQNSDLWHMKNKHTHTHTSVPGPEQKEAIRSRMEVKLRYGIQENFSYTHARTHTHTHTHTDTAWDQCDSVCLVCVFSVCVLCVCLVCVFNVCV